MIALLTFRPSFCPNCGVALNLIGYAGADFDAKASFSHPCGLDYQRIGEDAALDAAEAVGGDLKRMRRTS